MHLVLPFLLLLSSCSQPGAQVSPLDALDARYVRIMNSLGIANRDTTRNIHNKEARERKIRREQERVAFFRDPGFRDVLETARASGDAATARKADAYARHAVYHRSWTKEEKGRETELLAAIQAQRQSTDVWTSADGAVDISLNRSWDRVASDAVGISRQEIADLSQTWVDVRTRWIGEDLDALVRLRNEVARREGFSTYWELSLFHQGLTPADVDALMAELEALVVPINTAQQEQIAAASREKGIPNDFAHQPALRRAAGLVLGEGILDAWFDADLAESRVGTAFARIGLPADGIQIYSGPSRYTRPGAYGFPLRPPEHVAIVMSSDRRWSTWQYRALAHEMGLATWWRSLPAEAAASPVLWEPPSPWFEGVGALFERLVMEPQFAADYVEGFPAELLDDLRNQRVQQAIYQVNRYLACTRLERKIYESPGEWAALSEATAAGDKQLLHHAWSPPTATNGLVYTGAFQSGLMLHYPAYVQNFLFAATTEALLWQVLEQEFTVIQDNPRVGPWLVENLFHPVALATSFPEQLDVLTTGLDRAEALRRFLQ